MQSTTSFRARKAAHPSTLPAVATGSPSGLSKRKPKAKKVGLLRPLFMVLGSFVFLPVLFLQHKLLSRKPDSTNTSSRRRDVRKTPRLQDDRRPRVLTAYLESPSTVTYSASARGTAPGPLFSRNTRASALQKIEFPRVQGCDPEGTLPDLPIDDFPTQDPFLPWLHDYFVSEDGRYVRFVGQNKRRCDTGVDNVATMAYWEPQVTLLQSIPVVVESSSTINSTTDQQDQPSYRYRLAASMEEATHPATRFQCQFYNPATRQTRTTLSVFKFDYEYVSWRKLRRPMIDTNGGKDSAMFWLSTLLFACPIPEPWQALMTAQQQSIESTSLPPLYLDLVPIRTPMRTSNTLLTINHTGPDEYASVQARLFPLEQVFGHGQYLPAAEDAGRWANLPICPRPQSEQLVSPVGEDTIDQDPKQPLYQFVACTWTAASYTRRGDVARVSDSAARLREWILFHLMVGVQHLYIYDNTDLTNSTLKVSELWRVAQEFPSDQVTYHAWPCKICNNNRPAHPNPGERSSQYAAEASCRERYGPLTDWMTFLDVDEYLVPMKQTSEEGRHDWRPILDDFKARDVPILQFLSSRARPRVEMMEEVEDQSVCKDPTGAKNERYPNTDACIGPKRDETFLGVYNCEYIRPPKPSRFARARKQIYQPSYVWSHFVHYSTVTAEYAETYAQFQQNPKSNGKKFLSHANGPTWEKRYPDVFVDELNIGALIHARSVMPHETRRRSAECVLGSKVACMLGYLCEDTVEFIDEKHQQNVFNNSDGSYCNCWANAVVATSLVPRLKQTLQEHEARLHSSR